MSSWAYFYKKSSSIRRCLGPVKGHVQFKLLIIKEIENVV